jgi:hypothetical protein
VSHPGNPYKRIAALAALTGALALALTPSLAQAEESNPNILNCLGHVEAGTAEALSEGQPVQYEFYCDGPITGYQLQSQIPMTGIQSPPLVARLEGKALSDSFSCSGDVPGYALNCVGAAKGPWERITGSFDIGTKLCTEPRVDPLLTVTYAYLEKGVVTQAIAGPFDLGKPYRCHPDAFSGSTRLSPRPPRYLHSKKHKRHRSKKRARVRGRAQRSRLDRDSEAPQADWAGGRAPNRFVGSGARKNSFAAL